MFQKISMIFLFVIMLVLPCAASGGVEVAPRIADREIVESLVELKAQQKALSQRMDDMNKRMDDMNKRMDDIMTTINNRFDSINNRFESIDSRFESITNLMVAMFGSVMALIIALVGYMIWDRRTAQKPLRKKMADLEDYSRQVYKHLDINNPAGSVTDRLVAAFRELAKTDEKVAEVLRSFSLL